MSAIPYYRTGLGKSQAEISRQDGRAFARRSRPWMLLIQPCLHFNNKLFLYKLAIFFYKVTIFSQRTFLSLPGERILIFYPQQQHFHRFRIILSFYLLNHPQLRKSGQVVGIRRPYDYHTAVFQRTKKAHAHQVP